MRLSLAHAIEILKQEGFSHSSVKSSHSITKNGVTKNFSTGRELVSYVSRGQYLVNQMPAPSNPEVIAEPVFPGKLEIPEDTEKEIQELISSEKEIEIDL